MKHRLYLIDAMHDGDSWVHNETFLVGNVRDRDVMNPDGTPRGDSDLLAVFRRAGIDTSDTEIETSGGDPEFITLVSRAPDEDRMPIAEIEILIL